MSDPTNGYSFASRPWAVVVWGGLVYMLVVLVPAGSLWFRAGDEGGEVMAAWAILAAGFALPVGIAVGLVAATRERLITRKDRPGRFAWTGHGIGAVWIGHWVVMVPFSFVALVGGMGSSGRTADAYFVSAAWGLLAWVGTALGVIILLATAAGFRRRTMAISPVLLPEIPHLVPSAALVALLTGPVMLVTFMTVAQGGDGRGYAMPMVLVLGGLGAVAAVGLAWTGAAAETEAARAGARPVTWFGAFGSYVGCFLGVQWGVAFMVTLLPAWDGSVGQRFILQVFCVGVLMVSAGLLGRRMARVEASAPTG